MDWLCQSASVLEQAPTLEALPAAITRQLQEIPGTVAASMAEYDEPNRCLIIRHLAVDPGRFGLVEKAVRLLGRGFGEVRSPIDPPTYRELVTETIGFRHTLTEMTFGAIPPVVGSAIQRLCGVGHFIGIPHVLEGRLYGASVLARGRGVEDPAPELLRSFAQLAAMALNRRRAESVLAQSEARFRALSESAREATPPGLTELERRRLEQELLQARKMESLGRLASGLAHDFNNLLQVVRGNVREGLSLAAGDAAVRERFEEIGQAAERSAGLVRQLLAFARKQDPCPRVFELDAALAPTRRMLERLVGPHIGLDWRLEADNGCVCLDPTQLDQIVFNLVLNARDALAGGGLLRVSTSCRVVAPDAVPPRATAPAGRHLTLEVSDTGCGMTPETQARLFEPFFTTKEPDQGTGLGLATVQRIVRQNGGFIQVRSEPGAGSTFRVFLPRVEPPPVATAAAPAPPEPGTETLLLVEDEEELLELTRSLLAAQGYQVLTARHAAEALETARKHAGSLDLLVTDLDLPDLNGKELWHRLRESRPGLRCLIVSGAADEDPSLPGVASPEARFLPKPFEVESLLEAIRAGLHRPGQRRPDTGSSGRQTPER